MNCKRCGLYKTAQSVRLMGQGPVPCKICVVGEAPGHREDDLNKPFQGDCGKELEKIFDKVGISREKIYITNVVHCRPPNNRKPKRHEIQQCLCWLEEEIKSVKPKFILLLGAVAISAFPELKGSITELRGKFFESNGMVLLPTFHPGAILRDDRKKPLLEADIKKFVDAVKHGVNLKVTGLNFKLANSTEDLALLFEELENEKYVSLDIETTGLSPFSTNELGVRVIGLGLKNTQWIIPLGHPESRFRNPEAQKNILEAIETSLKDKIVIMQNGKFDSKWLKVKYGVDIKFQHDTMMLSYLLDENNLHGLKYLANRFFGAPDYDISMAEKIGPVKLEKLAKYCATDVFYTRKLCFLFIKELMKDPALLKFYKKVIMPISNIYRDIEINGIYINKKKMDLAESVLLKQISDMKKELGKYGDNINWNSTQQLAKLLFDEIGLDPLDRTETGGNSTSESVLKRLSEKHELPKLILKYREYYGLLSKFITGWKEKLISHKLYPSFKIHGTVTGRPSCEEPNLQQTPRDPRIRSLITAPPGWSLVEFDYGQIELRVAAMLANERAMKLAFQTGEDIHTKTAISISGRDLSKLSGFEAKEWRKKAKPINFGFLYGMGVKTFLIYARDKYDMIFTKREGFKYRRIFFETYPDLIPWHGKQRRIVKINKLVRNLAGRVRHLPDIDSPDEALVALAERQAINSPVQGLASDFTLMSVIEIYNTFSQDIIQISGTVHDSILIRIKNEHLKEVVPQIIKIMESPKLFKELNISPTVPIVVNASIGPWSEGKEWKGEQND